MVSRAQTHFDPRRFSLFSRYFWRAEDILWESKWLHYFTSITMYSKWNFLWWLVEVHSACIINMAFVSFWVSSEHLHHLSPARTLALRPLVTPIWGHCGPRNIVPEVRSGERLEPSTLGTARTLTHGLRYCKITAGPLFRGYVKYSQTSDDWAEKCAGYFVCGKWSILLILALYRQKQISIKNEVLHWIWPANRRMVLLQSTLFVALFRKGQAV